MTRPSAFYVGWQPIDLSVEIQVKGNRLLGLRIKLISACLRIACKLALGETEITIRPPRQNCQHCGQKDIGQTGDCECPKCGLPRQWDA